MLAFGNEGVAGLVKRTPGAIGYCESGLAERAGLPMAWLQNKAGNYVQPSHDSGLETLENAVLPENFRAFFPDPDGQGSYPIVTYTWMLLYGRYVDGDKRRELIDFVQWCISDGQKFNEDLGYIRISADTARRVKAAVAGIK